MRRSRRAAAPAAPTPPRAAHPGYGSCRGMERSGRREAVRPSEEAFLLLLARFKARLDELDKDPVGARMARLSQRLDATGSAWGEAHALADGFVYGCHGSKIHQHAP